MRSKRSKKWLAGGFTAAVGFIAAASVAYACVPLLGTGQVNVSGSGTIQNSQSVTGSNGAGGNLRYCGNINPTTEAQANAGNVITVTVGPSTGTCASQLSERDHTVILNNALSATASPYTLVNGSWSHIRPGDDTEPGRGCFISPSPAGNIILDNAFAVPASGSATGTYTLPALNRVDDFDKISSLCVGHPNDSPPGSPTNAEGIIVPIKINDITI